MKHFDSFGAFAAHLTRLAAKAPAVMHHATDRAAAIIEERAKDEIGQYQPAVGPYPAWPPLAESTEARKASAGYPVGAPLLATGEMYGSVGRTVSGTEAVIGAEDPKIVYHELGTDRIPPRPVFGPAAFGARDTVRKLLGVTTAAWVAGNSWVRPRAPKQE